MIIEWTLAAKFQAHQVNIICSMTLKVTKKWRKNNNKKVFNFDSFDGDIRKVYSEGIVVKSHNYSTKQIKFEMRNGMKLIL